MEFAVTFAGGAVVSVVLDVFEELAVPLVIVVFAEILLDPLFVMLVVLEAVTLEFRD